MLSKHAATYLNDHLAGSITALEMLDLIISSYPDCDAATAASSLRDEVIADRKVLEDLMERLGISQNALRKTSAWLAEKGAQIKLRWDDPAGGSFRLHEAFEAVSLGIEGKRLLWILLAALGDSEPALQTVDYSVLIRRAEDQRARAETARLAAARDALVTTPDT
jgi:hypothetical protein